MMVMSILFNLGGVHMGKLQPQAEAQIREICARYKDEKTPLMMILSDVQNEYGYIPLEVQEVVSEETGISVAEIYGVVTFYSFFSLKPKGKYVIGCCLGTDMHERVPGGCHVILITYQFRRQCLNRIGILADGS